MAFTHLPVYGEAIDFLNHELMSGIHIIPCFAGQHGKTAIENWYYNVPAKQILFELNIRMLVIVVIDDPDDADGAADADTAMLMRMRMRRGRSMRSMRSMRTRGLITTTTTSTIMLALKRMTRGAIPSFRFVIRI